MNASADIAWKISPDSITVTRDEFRPRNSRANMAEKFEASHGKMLWDDKHCLYVLAMRLKAIGLHRAPAVFTSQALHAALADTPPRP